MTVDAGVQWYEAYDVVNEYGRLMIGAICVGGSVGAAGGWLAGGGHSTLSPGYGLGEILVDKPAEREADHPMQASITHWKYPSCFLQANI